MPNTEQTTPAPQEARDHDARRHLLVRALANESIHKKFDAGRGREPIRQTVDRKLIMDLMRRMLLESLGNPSVPYSHLRPEEVDADDQATRRACALALATDRDVILPKGRKTGICVWRDVPVDLQLVFGLIAMAEAHDGLVFSLNLGNDLGRRLTPGTKETRNMVRKRIADALKAKLGFNVPLIMVLEVEEQGRLHVHGALGLHREEIESAAAALRVAGGKWAAAGGQYQVDVREMYDSVGWWKYIMKHLRRRPIEERGKWVGWSQPAKRLAKDWHKTTRRWWAENCDALSTRHSMHFFIGDTLFSNELQLVVDDDALSQVYD